MTNREKREKFCYDQIRRLQGLDFFPADDVARGELVKVLLCYSRSDSHAERIIDAVLANTFGESGRCCPTPFELADLAQGINPDGVRKPVAWAQCPLCYGTGWADTEYIPPDGPFAGQKYRGVKRCACKGRMTA